MNADRPAIADRCITVTRANCKYGRAVNLARRQKDYHKTFGQQNVRFRFFAVTEQYAVVEALVGQRLAAYRILGASGRPNEWLQGIGPDEVEEVVKSVLATLPAGTTPLIPPSSRSPTSFSDRQAPIGVSPTNVVEAAEYLEQQRMQPSLLKDLHHSPRRDETFASTRRYFSKKFDLHLKNQLYGARLIFVAREHQSSGRPLEELVLKALRRHPK